MQFYWFFIPGLCLTLSACNMSEQKNRNTETNHRNLTEDNRALNPTNQSETASDRDITQAIRQALMSDSSFSNSAKNIKVITIDGTVTLRGSVSSEREKMAIENKAKQINGVSNVDNQLEIIQR